MKKIIVSIIITVFVLSSGNVLAQGKGDSKSFGKKMCTELNLTDTQQKSIEDLKAEKQKKLIDLKAEIQKKQIDMKKLLADGFTNENEFLKLTDYISKLKSEMRSLNAKHLVAVSKILNDDQKKMWLEKTRFNNDRGERMGCKNMKNDMMKRHMKGDRKGLGKEIQIEKKIIKE
ncbi:MAG: Spy/CpxP family protein refolding chaperone [Melioribacteraceae bacterium]|nr:Spy/CpxP family protein refolding chaperone [Melioribacteraceae bacterium]